MSSALYFISYKGVASFVSGLPGAFLGCCIYIIHKDIQANVVVWWTLSCSPTEAVRRLPKCVWFVERSPHSTDLLSGSLFCHTVSIQHALQSFYSEHIDIYKYECDPYPTLHSSNTFHPEFTASLNSLGPLAWVKLSKDQVCFTIIPEQGTQVWA